LVAAIERELVLLQGSTGGLRIFGTLDRVLPQFGELCRQIGPRHHSRCECLLERCMVSHLLPSRTNIDRAAVLPAPGTGTIAANCSVCQPSRVESIGSASRGEFEGKTACQIRVWWGRRGFP